MPENEPKNPYREVDDGQEIRLSRRFAVILSALFLLAIVLAPVARHLWQMTAEKDARWLPLLAFFNHPNSDSEEVLKNKRKGNPGIERTTPNLRDHLQSFEKKVEGAPFSVPPQRILQSVFTRVFDEGNSRCHIGRDGWFFYRPALEAIMGYGPLKPEPDSVTKDPDRPIWSAPLPEVLRFASELHERGVPLLLVPVPTKAMVYPEHLGLASEDAPLHHPDRARFIDALSEAGVEVLDLLPAMVAAKEKGQLYLKQDTHWTRLGMEVALDALVTKVKALGVETGEEEFVFENLQRNHLGDLVEMLKIDAAGLGFLPEQQEVVAVVDPETGKPVAGDERASVVVLGDSFANIYHAPGIGFGAVEWDEVAAGMEPLIGGGVAQHLAARLSQKIDFVAVNGGGATEARQKFAREREDDLVRAKQLVIWLLAERDLFLSATPAGSEVLFRPVVWNPHRSKPIEAVATRKAGDPGSGENIVLEVSLTERSGVNDPEATPYKDSLFTAIFSVDSVVAGSFEEKEVLVVLWGFRNRKYLPSSKIEVGKRYRLTLEPWDAQVELQSMNLRDDLLLFLDQWFAFEVEPL